MNFKYLLSFDKPSNFGVNQIVAQIYLCYLEKLVNCKFDDLINSTWKSQLTAKFDDLIGVMQG